MKASKIEYTIERNRRMESYKGRYNCEASIDGSYLLDAQGDTASEARKAAERKVAQWQARNAK